MRLREIASAAECGRTRQIAEDRRSLFAPMSSSLHRTEESDATKRRREAHNQRVAGSNPAPAMLPGAQARGSMPRASSVSGSGRSSGGGSERPRDGAAGRHDAGTSGGALVAAVHQGGVLAEIPVAGVAADSPIRMSFKRWAVCKAFDNCIVRALASAARY